ncbi:MAG: hypothetical protein OXT74_14455 [Candidatus Poribacteria bacterium]|nr:hypothetical protein [Candidatus Poribacteria bacterium]
MSDDNHILQQLKELRTEFSATRNDLHDVKIAMERITTQLEHGSDRFDKICTHLNSVEERVDVVERRIDVHDGEFTMVKWIWSGLVGLGVIGATLIMLWK